MTSSYWIRAQHSSSHNGHQVIFLHVLALITEDNPTSIILIWHEGESLYGFQMNPSSLMIFFNMYRQISDISCTKSQYLNVFVSSCSCFCAIYWGQGADSIQRYCLTPIDIPIVEIRPSYDWLSYLHNFISYTSKVTSLYWIRGQMLSREWTCSWSSTDRWCPNYIWVIRTTVWLILEVWQYFKFCLMENWFHFLLFKPM